MGIISRILTPRELNINMCFECWQDVNVSLFHIFDNSVYIFAMAYSDVQHPHDYPLAVDADASEPVIHHVKYSNFSKAARNRDAYSQHLCLPY